MTDRRAHLRFQLVGPGRATILAIERLTLVNVGLSGVLVEAPFPLAVNAELPMQLVLPGHVSEAVVKVRRVVPADSGSAGQRYRIGLEFLSLSPEAQEVIATAVATDRAATM